MFLRRRRALSTHSSIRRQQEVMKGTLEVVTTSWQMTKDAAMVNGDTVSQDGDTGRHDAGMGIYSEAVLTEEVTK